jgi:hypothetical protein
MAARIVVLGYECGVRGVTSDPLPVRSLQRRARNYQAFLGVREERPNDVQPWRPVLVRQWDTC